MSFFAADFFKSGTEVNFLYQFPAKKEEKKKEEIFMKKI